MESPLYLITPSCVRHIRMLLRHILRKRKHVVKYKQLNRLIADYSQNNAIEVAVRMTNKATLILETAGCNPISDHHFFSEYSITVYSPRKN